MPFIAFDGLDGAGKSTLVDMLASHLRAHGLDPLVLSHPTHDGLGGWLRKLLHQDKQRFHTWTETYLYAADLAEAAETVVRPALAAGRWVLAHRWWYSSCVYQAHIDGADWDDVRGVSLEAVRHLKPDAGVIVICDPQLAANRIAARSESSVSPYENLPHLERALEGFNKFTFEALQRRRSQSCSTEDQEPLAVLDTGTKAPHGSFGELLAALRQFNIPVP